MIPVTQTTSGAEGNCFEACLASILELTIADVPRLHCWKEVTDWLDSKGYTKVHLQAINETIGMLRGPTGYSIAAVLTPGGQVHSVVCCNGRLVHDPALKPVADEYSPVLLWTSIRKQK